MRRGGDREGEGVAREDGSHCGRPGGMLMGRGRSGGGVRHVQYPEWYWRQ